MLYVDPNGNDLLGVLGDSHNPYATPRGAKDAAKSGDLINIHAGTYTITPDDADVLLDQLAKDGETIHYIAPIGTTLISQTNSDNLLGMGSRSGGFTLADPATEFHLEADIVDFEDNGFNSVVGAFGGAKFSAKINEMYVRDDALGMEVMCPQSNVEIGYMYCEGTRGYDSGSAASQGTYAWKRYAKIGHIDLIASTSATAVGHQGASNWLEGTLDHIEVGSIHVTGVRGGRAYTQNVYNTSIGVGGTFTFRCGSIRGEQTGVLPYADYENSSNNALNRGEILHSGGGIDTSQDSTFSAIVDSIYSNIPAMSIHGTYLDNSTISIDVKHCITLQAISIGFFNPHLDNDSRIIIRGNYRNQSTDQPVGMLSYPNVNDTSVIIFEDCRFEGNVTNGKSCIQIADGSATAKLIFKNCTFICDPTQPAISTDSVTPIEVIIYDCITNTNIVDANITELVEAIKRDPNVK